MIFSKDTLEDWTKNKKHLQENITLLNEIGTFPFETSNYHICFLSKALHTNVACVTTLNYSQFILNVCSAKEEATD